MNASKELNLGRAGEYIAMADLLLKGEQAFTTGQGINYDLVVEKDGRMIRLQVKATRKMRVLAEHANPVYFFNIKRTGKRGTKKYELGAFEGFALVALDRRAVYYLKFDGQVGTASICIRDRENDYSGKRGSGRRSGLYLQDLTWENFNR